MDQVRVQAVLGGKSHLKDRDEEEIRGYRDALRLIHEQADKMPVTEDTILRLHTLTRGQIWDSGKYKDKVSDITLSDLELACPGVSRDMIRDVLRQMQKEDEVECLGRGPGAPWEKKRFYPFCCAPLPGTGSPRRNPCSALEPDTAQEATGRIRLI